MTCLQCRSSVNLWNRRHRIRQTIVIFSSETYADNFLRLSSGMNSSAQSRHWAAIEFHFWIQVFPLMRLLESLLLWVLCMSFIVIKASSIVTMNVISGSGVFKHVLFVSTVALNDRCKMFCRVASSSAYYMLTDRVVDGTKCGPFTSDICLQGKCHVSTPFLLLPPPSPPPSSPPPFPSFTLPSPHPPSSCCLWPS